MSGLHNNIAPVSCLVLADKVELKLRLTGFSVEREIGRIPVARLEMLDGNPAKGKFEASEMKPLDPGTELEVKLGPKGKEETVFRGLITHQSISAAGGGRFHLYVECRDRAYRMSLDRKTRFHHQSANPQPGADSDSVGDTDDDAVIEYLVGQRGYDLQLANNAPLQGPEAKEFRHENLMQYHSTDWDFLQMRLEASGRLCYVNDGEVVVFKPKIGGENLPILEFGHNLLSFEADFDSTVGHASIESHSWDIDRLEAQGSEAQSSGLAETAGQMGLEELGSRSGVTKRDLLHGGDLKMPEAKIWAQTQAERLALAKVRGTAKIRGEHRHKPGDVVELRGFGRHWDGKALVSGVKHEYQRGKWNTYLQIGLNAKPHAEKFPVHAAPASDLMPAVPGLLYGTVQGYKKSPGGYELIEVELVAPAEGEAPKTVFARHAASYASAKGGAFFRPEPGDEVVLGFIQQDPRFPVILGSFLSSKVKAEGIWELEKGKQQVRGFQFRKDNREVFSFSFDENENLLTVATPSNTFVLDEKNKEIRLEDGHKNSIKMDSAGITLESENGEITLKGGTFVESKAGSSSVKVDAKSVTAKSTMVDIKSDSVTQVKGSVLDLN